MLLGHGDDIYIYNQPITSNFSSNVNYNGLNDQLKQHLITQFDKVNNYPEVNAESLQLAIANNYAIEKENILVTNGATEAFYLIAQTYANTNATILVPAFAEYEDGCRINNISLSFVNYRHLCSETVFNTELVFICNPNNPTGLAINNNLLETIIKNNLNSLFVLDEAYIDFTLHSTSLANQINQFPNVIIVKSLTKAYTIPGLRLGYILTSKAIINKIMNYKIPWSVNTLAIAAGKYILQHQKKFQPSLHQLLNDTQQLSDSLNKIDIITAHATHSHFFLCETGKATAAALKAFLISNYGILIRDAGNFKTLTAQHFRLATQTPEQNQLLISGIKAWSNQL